MFKYNDGGRAAAGYKGRAGDCVTRAIAIATGRSYQAVYDTLTALKQVEHATKRIPITPRRMTARSGVSRKVCDAYLNAVGWVFVPTMTIGGGCTVHLKADELPGGAIICRVSKHMVAVIDGVIQDTGDCSREGTRCVYGYYIFEGIKNV
jgi:hypothetical protein